MSDEILVSIVAGDEVVIFDEAGHEEILLSVDGVIVVPSSEMIVGDWDMSGGASSSTYILSEGSQFEDGVLSAVAGAILPTIENLGAYIQVKTAINPVISITMPVDPEGATLFGLHADTSSAAEMIASVFSGGNPSGLIMTLASLDANNNTIGLYGDVTQGVPLTALIDGVVTVRMTDSVLTIDGFDGFSYAVPADYVLSVASVYFSSGIPSNVIVIGLEGSNVDVDLPEGWKNGSVYRVTGAGTYAGKSVGVGDFVTVISDGADIIVVHADPTIPVAQLIAQETASRQLADNTEQAARIAADTLEASLRVQSVAALQTIADSHATRLTATETLTQSNVLRLDDVEALAQTNQLTLGGKADVVEMEAIAAQAETNRLALLTKADITALATLTTLVGTKADQSYVNDQIANLVGTDGQVLAAIQAIADELANAEGILEALDQTVANRVRFDVATQALTSLQKYNARTNIGAEEVGTAAMLVAQVTVASLGAATAAQGVKADSALQSGDVAPVALSGNYADLIGRPTLPTNTDGLNEGTSNQYFTSARVRAALMTGISFATATAVLATDGLLVAVGKLQAQINTNTIAITNKVDLVQLTKAQYDALSTGDKNLTNKLYVLVG